jgi:thioredoxin 1
MASDAVLEFTDQNFDQEVINANVPVLVDFWAEWCMPCRMLTPTIDAIASETAGKAKVGKVNVDHHQGVAVKFGIQSIPTVMLFKNGQMVKKWVGVVQKGALTEALAAG